MLKGCPVGSIGGANPSGWSNEQLFLEFLKHFKKHVKPAVEDPVLLILDNHDSHVNIEAIDYCKKNGIIMLTFHPHTSHKMQPLDRTVFGPLKTYYNLACNEWMVMNPARPITIYEIAELVGKAYPRAFSSSNIQKGFEVSGLYPLNENIFKEHEYLTSFVTDRPQNTDTYPEEQQEIATSSTDSAVPSSSNAPLHSSPPITPEMLRPYPKAPARKRKGGRPKGKSRILTDTPKKEEIMSQKQGKILKEVQTVTKRLLVTKPKKKQRKVSESQSENNFT